MISLGLSLYSHTPSDLTIAPPILPPPPEPPVPFTVSATAVGGTLDVVTGGGGDLSVTISNVTNPAAFNGVYAQDIGGNALNAAALGAGPQCLVAVAIQHDGTPAPGETLTSTPGLWIHDGTHPAPALAYQWFRDGAAIPGATGPGYVMQAADQGATLTLRETATDAGGARSGTSAGVAVPVPFTVSATAVGGTLDVVTGGGGDLSVTISNVTNPAAFNGVYAQDIGGNALNAAALGAGPQCLVAVAIQHDGTPAPGETLTSTPGLWIHDGTHPAPALAYQWFRDGAAIPGATGPGYVMQAADQGATLTLRETATDAGGARSGTSAGVAVPVPFTVSATAVGGTLDVVTGGGGDLSVTISNVTNPAAFNGVYAQDIGGNALNAAALGAGPQCLVAVAIQHDGTPAPGETLTSTPGLWIHDGTHPAPALAYQWFRDGAAIPGATGPGYVMQAADQGATLTLRETATDAGGARSGISAGVAIPAPPSLAVAQLVDGTLEVSMDSSGDLSVTLSGVTDPAAYNGVYAQDVAGNALNAALLRAGPQCLVAVVVQHDGTPAPGETLTSTPGLWIYDSSRADPVLSHQWFRDGAAIPGATGPSYVMQAADQGATLILRETATDAGGARSGTSAGVAVPAAPSFSVARLGGFQSSGAVTAAPFFTIDTSAAKIGDDIYFAYGGQRYSSTATVNSISATKVSVDAGNSSAGRLTVFRYTLQAGDIGPAISIIITIDSTQGHHVFDCWHISGGTLTDTKAAQHGATPDPVTVTPTVAGTDNCVLVWGVGTGWSSMAYSGATEVQTASLPTASSRSMTVGRVEDVPAGARTITLTPGASGHLGVAVIALKG